ncbi:hypothetical protein Prum_035300 [Phytohabitans rumicis]|uniref:Uncharacterized protein n=1 Tax=Phytohabitans rumicis TaxID=1076125 RepID=A0A6V8L4I9_9ACTN|nr:hypothetical protein Prum_035300 [Phytohabitans rumicis]
MPDARMGGGETGAPAGLSGESRSAYRGDTSAQPRVLGQLPGIGSGPGSSAAPAFDHTASAAAHPLSLA